MLVNIMVVKDDVAGAGGGGEHARKLRNDFSCRSGVGGARALAAEGPRGRAWWSGRRPKELKSLREPMQHFHTCVT